MLLQTFCHIPGVGEKIERRIWEEGITTWEEALGYPALEKIVPSKFSPFSALFPLSLPSKIGRRRSSLLRNI